MLLGGLSASVIYRTINCTAMKSFEGVPKSAENREGELKPSEIFLYAQDSEDKTDYSWQGRIWRKYSDGEYDINIESQNTRTDIKELAENLAQITEKYSHPDLPEPYQLSQSPSQEIVDELAEDAQLRGAEAPAIRGLSDEEFQDFQEAYNTRV